MVTLTIGRFKVGDTVVTKNAMTDKITGFGVVEAVVQREWTDSDFKQYGKTAGERYGDLLTVRRIGFKEGSLAFTKTFLTDEAWLKPLDEYIKEVNDGVLAVITFVNSQKSPYEL